MNNTKLPGEDLRESKNVRKAPASLLFSSSASNISTCRLGESVALYISSLTKKQTFLKVNQNSSQNKTITNVLKQHQDLFEHVKSGRMVVQSNNAFLLNGILGFRCLHKSKFTFLRQRWRSS